MIGIANHARKQRHAKSGERVTTMPQNSIMLFRSVVAAIIPTQTFNSYAARATCAKARMSAKKPRALKAISGTDRPFRREEEIDVVYDDDIVENFPDPPQYLNVDGAAIWRRLGPPLAASGALREHDLYPFEQLCYMWQQYQATAKLGRNVSASENGALTAAFSVFGIGPAHRKRLFASKPAAEAPPTNRFTKFAKRGA